MDYDKLKHLEIMLSDDEIRLLKNALKDYGQTQCIRQIDDNLNSFNSLYTKLFLYGGI